MSCTPVLVSAVVPTVEKTCTPVLVSAHVPEINKECVIVKFHESRPPSESECGDFTKEYHDGYNYASNIVIWTNHPSIEGTDGWVDGLWTLTIVDLASGSDILYYATEDCDYGVYYINLDYFTGVSDDTLFIGQRPSNIVIDVCARTLLTEGDASGDRCPE